MLAFDHNFKIDDVIGQPHLWDDPVGALKWYLIPMFAGGLASTANTMRVLRSQMLEVLRDDYIRTARAKGLNERSVVMRHALRNALLPVLTPVMGLTVATVVGSQIVLEQMFNIPGVGRLLFTSIFLRDYPLTQGLDAPHDLRHRLHEPCGGCPVWLSRPRVRLA